MKIDRTQGGAKQGCGELRKEFLALRSLRLWGGQGLGGQPDSDNRDANPKLNSVIWDKLLNFSRPWFCPL